MPTTETTTDLQRPKARLTALDVALIRSLRGNAKHREIASKAGVSRPHVTRILGGRAWKEAKSV